MTARTSGPRASRAGRLATYIAEMFPPWMYLPYGLSVFASVYFSLQAMHSPATLALGWRAWLGAISVVLFMLLMRVYDELKDIEGDIELGRAGDPRYVDRAVVTGHVTKNDIRALRWIVTAAVVAINIPIGYPWPAVAFVVVFAVTWLSFKWFFWPAVSKNLLLALLTHNPITAIVAAYVVAIAVHDYGTSVLDYRVAFVLGAVWLPVAAWETSRKIRIPEDETGYQTYSMLLGPKVAALLPALLVSGATACLLIVAEHASLSWIFRGIAIAAAALCVAACVRFRIAPTTANAKLQPFFEGYSVVASIGFAVALVAEHGVRL